jgi:hypothetical protein
MQEFQLPNSRLLYKKSNVASNWMPTLMKIDQAIENHPRLQRASDQFHLYFFKRGNQMSENEDMWVSREIIGHLNPGELEGLETYDLAKGKALGLSFDLESGLEFKDILEKEESLRRGASKEYADTWRVSFYRENGEMRGKIGLF